jgi:hypothetical protein
MQSEAQNEAQGFKNVHHVFLLPFGRDTSSPLKMKTRFGLVWKLSSGLAASLNIISVEHCPVD